MLNDIGLPDCRWYKHYVWSPWDADLMEDRDVISMNLALHYKDAKPGRNHHEYSDDMNAAVCFLANFSSAVAGRVAIWRETTPQHFKSKSGIFTDTDRYSGCGAPMSTRALGRDDTEEYNRLARRAFSEFCKCSIHETRFGSNGSTPQSCIAYDCVMNHTAAPVSFESLFSWQVLNCNNYTLRVRRNVLHSGARQRSSHRHTPDRVCWWPVLRLFDVPEWHMSDGDCSHYCFIPALFDESFLHISDILQVAGMS